MSGATISLYQSLMGDSFQRLPPAVRALHGATAGVLAAGTCDVRRGRNALSRLMGRMLGVPGPGDAVDLRFEIDARGHGERWIRRFGRDVMRSHFWAENGALCERLGPVVMTHSLEIDGDALHTRLLRLWFIGIPVPRALHPRIRAVATQDGELYRFDVAAEMPVIGLVVSYCGHLDVTGVTP